MAECFSLPLYPLNRLDISAKNWYIIHLKVLVVAHIKN